MDGLYGWDILVDGCALSRVRAGGPMDWPGWDEIAEAPRVRADAPVTDISAAK